MAEENKEHGEKLDKILGHLDSLHAKHDALHARAGEHDTKIEHLMGRMDAMEEKMKDGDADSEHAKEVLEEKERADKARKDAEEKACMDAARKDAEEKEEKERADKARKDAEEEAMKDTARMDALQGRLDKLEKNTTPVPEAEKSKYVAIQQRIDEVAQAFGDSGGAPRWLEGETVPDYQRRLLTKYKTHSPAWKDKDLMLVHDSVLEIADEQIRKDSLAASRVPGASPGQLIARQSRDQFGRSVTKFFGDPAVAYAPFMFGGIVRRGRITPAHELRRMN